MSPAMLRAFAHRQNDLEVC